MGVRATKPGTVDSAISLLGFGCAGNGTTDDYTKMQAAWTAAASAGKPIYVDDGYTFLTGTAITVSTVVSVIGSGTLKTTANIPLLTYDVNTTSVNGWFIDGPRFSGPTTTDSSSCALRFTGDATALIQYGYVNVYCNGFNAFMKDEKTGRTTGFGTESMLNWNFWNVRLVNQGTYGFWYTQGSGTGTVYAGNITIANAGGSACFFFDGSGCVVGDVAFAGLQLGSQTAGGIGIKIGASTAYRAQWDFTGVQFDANCDIPISMSATGSQEYINWNITGANWGGNTALGANLQPLSHSVVTDRDTSFWQAGNSKTSNTTGAISQNVFTIDFGAYGAAHVKVYASGLIGGVSACSSYSIYEIREGTGSLTITLIESYVGVTNGFSATITGSGTTATVNIACTSSSSGTAYNTTVEASGNKFKISRS